ncbi:MAG: M20/M25/M40 family metallo-hydrolase, partial [Actinomycetota bacterium]|nr:M20/M25/M40 family metallo-hydrolase [Actinomycetota bacterium]
NLDLLRELLRADTTNPPGNETAAVEILEAELSGAGLETTVEKSPQGRPNLIARLPGPTDVPALILLSHTDVVGVEPERWTHDPFAGEVDDGAVWGRGALDMKGIAAMHAAAATSLAGSSAATTREVIVCAVADEEAGGNEGAGWLVEAHPDLVGLSEGRPPPDVLGEGSFGITGILDEPIMPIVLGEKTAMWVELAAQGDPGHGSLPPTDQAVLNLASALAKVSGFGRPRVHSVMREQFRLLAERAGGPRRPIFKALASASGSAVAAALKVPLRSSGAIAALLSDTSTPTMISGGYKHNVVPGEAKASLDCRLLPDTDPTAFVESMRKRVKGVSVRAASVHRGPVSERGSLFEILGRASESLGSNPIVVPSLSPGFTDVRYFRQRGATGYGWAPIVLTPELLQTIHGHNERIPVDEFENGTRAMVDVVRRAAT